MRKNISITNVTVEAILADSSNSSQLIEEAILYYYYAYKRGILTQYEIERIKTSHLIAE